MRGPDGKEIPNRGVYFEVVVNQRIAFTDACTKAREPAEKPFMTVILTFGEANGKTRDAARVRHWTVADREMRAQMGFDRDWGQGTDPLAALVEQP